jgi:hypothetical protein
MTQQGQVFELKRRGRDGEPRWAYRYRAGGRGFRLFEPFLRPSHLPPVATGCDRWAP